ncbi:MAG TPA: Gfo/Idh/MocA family oxidoreductase, partial [Burkholderiaceae bacterium]|nr:Gfo/Idh/MocA family oxidoreductase [Burkholderiaceae bacterium]
WVCARDAQRLAAVPLPEGVRRTTRLDDILQDPRVRAVLVLTPPAAHLDVVRLVAAAGKHVLVEKPLELDLARAQELVACCEAAGVQLAVMLQYRLREAATHLRQLLHSGMLGQLTSASASVRWWRPQSYYDVPGRGTRARDGGGVLMTQAIHTLDLLLDLIGSPQKVSGAVATSAVHQMECEDTASALLHYPGGAVAVLQATTAASPGYPERIEINMTGGTATLESGRLRLTTMDGRTETVGADSGTGGGADPMAFDHGPHRVVIQDFLEAVRDGRPPAVTGRSALAVQRVIEAIMASSAQGRPVALEPGNA